MVLAIDGGGGVAARQSSSSTPPAANLVAQATDGATGTVDTRQLASWVVEAAHASPDKASAAFAGIEAQLGTGDRSRFAQDVVDIARGGSALSASGLAQGSVATGSRVLKSNPVLRIEWHSTVSPVTNRAGFSGPLRALLDQHGIVHDVPVHSRPPAAVNNNSPALRTHNGDAARDQIAREMQARGFDTRVEQSTDVRGRDVPGEVTPRGGRRIDVVATRPGADAENKVRVDVESKLGRASADSKTLAQVEKDGARLASNTAARELGQTVKVVGKVARPVGLVVDAVQVGVAVKQDGGTFGDHTQHAVGSLAGGAAGAWAGAEAGAAIGSLGGPVGTVVGGLAGAAIGGIVGSGAGEKAVDWVKSIF